jgi:3-methyladenine DNA glycosylase/8-oxoguanine DNA glycosylase
MQITLRTPPFFSLPSTVYSHGWCALEPFGVREQPLTLTYTTQVKGLPIDLYIVSRDDNSIRVTVQSAAPIKRYDRAVIAATVSHMLRFDESFDEFYSIIKKEKELAWIRRHKAGRMLRSATLFEDIIKMIATTNCSWSLTTLIVKNLCSRLGKRAPSGTYTFPAPADIAAQSDTFLREEIRAGYRSPYMLEVSEAVASGKIDLDSFYSNELSTEELYTKLTSLKGIGPYAAENLLKLLGHYDHLGLDSWSRKKFSQIHKNGRKVSDKVIVRKYGKYGKWGGLVFWLEMTKDWYFEKFPI